MAIFTDIKVVIFFGVGWGVIVLEVFAILTIGAVLSNWWAWRNK